MPTPPDSTFESRSREDFGKQCFIHLIGATMAVLKPGFCEIQVPFRHDLAQQHGCFHGGVIGPVEDVVSGYAALSLLPPGST